MEISLIVDLDLVCCPKQQHIRFLQNGQLSIGSYRMTSKPEVARIFPKLPTKFVYLKAIAQCFEETYYKYHYSDRMSEIKCPGPDRCVVSSKCFQNILDLEGIW